MEINHHAEEKKKRGSLSWIPLVRQAWFNGFKGILGTSHAVRPTKTSKPP